MTIVDESELKRNTIYLIYCRNVQDSFNSSLCFFKYRGRFNKCLINVVIYGEIIQHINRNVSGNFWKTKSLICWPTNSENSILFEIDVDEFAKHIVSEII